MILPFLLRYFEVFLRYGPDFWTIWGWQEGWQSHLARRIRLWFWILSELSNLSPRPFDLTFETMRMMRMEGSSLKCMTRTGALGEDLMPISTGILTHSHVPQKNLWCHKSNSLPDVYQLHCWDPLISTPSQNHTLSEGFSSKPHVWWATNIWKLWE